MLQDHVERSALQGDDALAGGWSAQETAMSAITASAAQRLIWTRNRAAALGDPPRLPARLKRDLPAALNQPGVREVRPLSARNLHGVKIRLPRKLSGETEEATLALGMVTCLSKFQRPDPDNRPGSVSD